MRESQLNLLCNLIADYTFESVHKPSLGMIVRLNAILFKIDSICREFPEWRQYTSFLLFKL